MISLAMFFLALQVTASHSYIDPAEKDIACKVHEEEVVRFYCEPCETCICVLCTFQVGAVQTVG